MSDRRRQEPSHRSERPGAVADRAVSANPRERLAALGPQALCTSELIRLVWATGAAGGNTPAQLADTALEQLGGVSGLAGATARELMSVDGIGEVRGAQLVAAFELGRRAASDWPAGRWSVRTPRDVADRLLAQMGRLPREELHVVLLNTRNVVLGVVTVYQGNVSTAVVRIGELFRDAIRQHAAAVILVHNHPSGDPTPSPDDLHLTAEAIAAGRLLDVAVLDHLVLGHDAFVSLRDRGVAFERSGMAA
jgi:DNA repair protein RadC